ncbi:NUDIX domain-containing protein [Alicyclobacillaceae bacterium I2511]|jgi:8-oxo-dGTP diphosphatase|nr:NUDIX domain-containing protein [Alicyclobacillaceae bacterium I2511]
MAPTFFVLGTVICYRCAGVTPMQIIVNCLTRLESEIVMLQKPRYGWFVLPGGKVEPGELWPDAARREVYEETGLTVSGLRLHGVHLLEQIHSDGSCVRQILAQFSAQAVEGVLLRTSKEGRLVRVSEQDLNRLPMDEGDRRILKCTLWSLDMPDAPVCYGKFTYATGQVLREWQVQPTEFRQAIFGLEQREEYPQR